MIQGPFHGHNAECMLVSKEFTFEAAHFLTQYHGKCERLHGHSYKLRIVVEGPVKEDGMVIDFIELKQFVKENVIDRYDHQNLNDFFENPTAEWVCKKIWEDLTSSAEAFKGVTLHEVTLWETNDSFVTYRGE